MADKPWKAFERESAALFGGKRKPANSGHRLDFESDTTIGQCKLVRVLSLEALTQLAEEMEREALPMQKAGVVAVKVRRGRGRPSPMLVVVTAAVWEHLNGKAGEQEGAPIPSRSLQIVRHERRWEPLHASQTGPGAGRHIRSCPVSPTSTGARPSARSRHEKPLLI